MNSYIPTDEDISAWRETDKERKKEQQKKQDEKNTILKEKNEYMINAYIHNLLSNVRNMVRKNIEKEESDIWLLHFHIDYHEHRNAVEPFIEKMKSYNFKLLSMVPVKKIRARFEGLLIGWIDNEYETGVNLTFTKNINN